MEASNCIDRLHYIINEFNCTRTIGTINFENKPVDKLNQVLSKLFDIDESNTTEVYSTYGSIFELCNDCINTIDKIAPVEENSSKNEFMKSKIDNAILALSSINLPNGDFKNFKSTLNNDTISNLKMLSYSLNSSEIVITENQLDKIYNDINLILDEVINSNISIKLKNFLSDRITEILIVVRKYKIHGSDDLLKAYEACIGSMYINNPTVDDKDKSFFANIFLKLIETISFLNKNIPFISYIEKQLTKFLE